MIFWGCLVFSRDFGRPKRAKVNIYFALRGCRASVVALHLGRWSCPLGAGGAGLLPDALPSWCVPAFCPLCCICFPALVPKYALFRVLRAFLAWFWCVCVGLYCLGALRGLCGFCAREWLGGLKACGVFASVFSFCPLLFFFFAYLQGLCFVILFLSSLPALFVLVSLWVFVFSFSLTDYTQKRKGAKVCPLRPRLSCCGCLDSCIVIEEFCCRCFGLFQLVRFVLPSNTARVGRLACSYFDFLRHYVNITNNCSAFLK